MFIYYYDKIFQQFYLVWKIFKQFYKFCYTKRNFAFFAMNF